MVGAGGGANDFDYDIYLTPKAEYSYNGSSPLRLGQDASAHLFVIAMPDWLVRSVKEAGYADDDAIAKKLHLMMLAFLMARSG